MEVNLDALIENCKKQDSKARMEVYQLFYGSVYNTCFRILRRQDEAEDAMQDSFIKVFEKIDTYNSSVSFRAWLKRIAINTAIDMLRKKKVVFLELDERTSVAEEEDVDNFHDNMLKVESIKKRIETLSEGYRLVLTLHLIEGYDYDEVAEILKISNSTVRSQYIRGKKRLLEILTVKG
ncbi:MAG: RNA polymerase sigma factor [Prevotellaceae bacterium]|jgi:RNA polymerase sigma-70 factor (ECF subfamily)|nr:RNA polymerase sigma factor [Prevotellaceae bacterium]